MSALFKLIHSFTLEERRKAALFIKKKNRRGDVKNLLLFDLICKGNTKNLTEKIYETNQANAYHALSKRLLNTLLDFIASHNFDTESSEEMRVFKLILAARILFEQEQVKLAWKTLIKAEKLAGNFDLFTALQEIYQTQLQYAHLKKPDELSQILLKSSINLKNLENELKLQQGYAFLKKELRDNPKEINALLNTTFKRFDIKPDQNLSYKSLYQFMDLISIAAELQSDYYSISPLIKESFAYIQDKETTTKYRYYHLQILHLMASIAFRNKSFKLAISYLEELRIVVTEKYKSLFSLKADTLLALAYNYIGSAEKAILICRESKQNSDTLNLILTTFYFQQNEINEAYSIFKSFNKSDQYYEKTQSLLWVVRKELVGLLLLIELDKLDLVLQKIKSIKRKLVSKLNPQDGKRLTSFLNLVTQYYENPDQAPRNEFFNLVEGSFNWIGTEREDLFVMSFYAWLKSKMEKRSLYEVTLELVNPTTGSH